MPYIADVIHELRLKDLESSRRLDALEATVRHLETMLLNIRRGHSEIFVDDVSRETEVQS